MLAAALVSRFTAAAAQYPIGLPADWDAYEAKLTRWVAEAAAAGARLAVFPEYGAMELAALDPATIGDIAASRAAVAALLPRVDALHARLARAHGLFILAASAPWRAPDGRFRNRARLFGPEGGAGAQDKLIMTRFERERWIIAGGDALSVFVTPLGRIGVCICYDAEFPLIARALVAAGAEILLVPSCTDTLHGLERVRVGARARALENQCLVIHAATVGEAPWSPAVDVNRGRAGVYGPPDGAFPDDGIVAQGTLDAPGWVFAQIDTATARAARRDGGMLNHRDWAEQPGLGAPVDVVEVVVS